MYKGVAQFHGNGCVMIVRRQDEQGVGFVGTGFLCHSKGYILTCAHSINLTDKLAIIPPRPINEFNQMTLEEVQAIDVMVAQHDPENDVSLLKIIANATVNVPQNALGNESIPKVGSSVCYFGFPFGHAGLHALKVSQSIISAKVQSKAGTKLFQLDAMVHEGNSGGPLVDLQSGQIIGIINGRFSPTGNGGMIKIGNHALGTESTISYASSINYGIELMKSEGLSV